MSMLNCNCNRNCNCRCNCTAVAVVASIILGILAAFLQITGAITVAAAFLWVILGIAVVYLGVLVIANTLTRCTEQASCACSSLGAILVGIAGSILFSIILLAVGIIATSIVSAILVGLLVFFFFLTILATACYVRYLGNCSNE